MPRIAIFSDPHGNLDGITATLDHAKKHDCDEFICLGDVADGGEKGDECVQLLRELNIPTTRGNHDEDCRVTPITEESRRWLQELPKQKWDDDILYTHISPDENEKKITSPHKAAFIFEDFPDFRVLFIGHLHFPVLFENDPSNRVEARLPKWKYGAPFQLSNERRYILCPGSIGYPRDGLRKLRYLIFEKEAQSITMMSFEGPLLDFGVYL